MTKFHQIKWAASPEGLLRDRKWRQPAHRVHRVSAAASISKRFNLYYYYFLLFFFFINFIDLILKVYYLLYLLLLLLLNDYFYFERSMIFLEIILFETMQKNRDGRSFMLAAMNYYFLFLCFLLFFFSFFCKYYGFD